MQLYEILFLIGIAFFAVAMVSGLCVMRCGKKGVPREALMDDSPPALDLLTPRGRALMWMCRACQALAALFLVAAFLVAFVRFG